MKILLYLAAVFAGIASAIEPGQNSTLAKELHQPWLAGLVVLAVNGAVFLAIGLLRGGLVAPTLAQIAQAPWWAWLGGISAAIIIAAQLFASEQIGAARFLGLLVTAGVVTSICLDNFGWVGFERHPASIWRIAGGLLMVVGVALVGLF